MSQHATHQGELAARQPYLQAATDAINSGNIPDSFFVKNTAKDQSHTLTVNGTPCYLTTIVCSTSIRMHGRPNTPLEGVGYRLFDGDGRIDVTFYIISPSSATNDNRRCAIKCLEELAKHPPSKVVQLYA